MAEQHVICGGLATQRAVPKNALRLDFQASNGMAQRVNLKLGDLSARMVEKIPSILTDLVEIATYVYAADQCTRRGGETMPGMGKDWFRQFRFRIPVRCPDVWGRADVRETLVDLLGFLSDDRFAFDFVPHPEPEPGDMQAYLDYSDSVDTGFMPDDVVLFSGGLDSFAGAVESLIGHGRRVALVSHQASPTVTSKQRNLIASLRERTESRQLFHVAVNASLANKTAVEFTQRTRSFLFATLGLIVARLFRRNTVRFYENGVVSTNLPVAAHVLGSRATRTTHPRVLSGFSRLFSLILDEPITVENPYFWKTKADVVDIIARQGCADLIAATFSCTRVREATRRQRHCGVCSQCLDRRFGILGANLEEYEPADAYGVDLFRGERQPGREVVMAESYVLQALKLATLSEAAFLSAFGQVFRILPYLPGEHEANAQMLYRLHRRHGETVRDVIDGALVRHASLTESLSLPETSLLMLIQSASVRLPEILDPVETEPPISEQATRDRRVTIKRPILFAVDEDGGRVVFGGGIEIKGAGFKIVKVLAEDFDEDFSAGRPQEDFRFTEVRPLSRRLDINEESLRQRITRFRKSLQRKFLDVLDVELDTNDVIENDRWSGYRLNPWLLRVPLARIRDPEVTDARVTSG